MNKNGKNKKKFAILDQRKQNKNAYKEKWKKSKGEIDLQHFNVKEKMQKPSKSESKLYKKNLITSTILNKLK